MPIKFTITAVTQPHNEGEVSVGYALNNITQAIKDNLGDNEGRATKVTISKPEALAAAEFERLMTAS